MTRHTRYLLCLVALFATFPALAQAGRLECAQFISGSRGDGPSSGYLTGSATVTETTTNTIGGTFGRRDQAGITSGRTRTTSTTYEVGTYRMNDGTTVEVDCRNYTIRR